MKLPLGIQTFADIRKDNYLYIDKTALLLDMIQSGKAYFLSRPRRFGKSLLISTLESLFAGEKSLFDGLAISETDYDFSQHPVMLLEFSNVDIRQADDLRNFIGNKTDEFAQKFGITLEIDSWEQRFSELVRKLQVDTGKQVVLLIDEYDKPVLDNLEKKFLPEVKSVLNTFYSSVKSLDKHLRFVLITGVTKFAKVSVFSGMNNLTDISMDRRYATLCGITQQELESTFEDGIVALTQSQSLQRNELLAKIKYWYNGYRFEEDAETVYNPYSLLSLFSKNKFSNYWFTTATPTFLLNLLRERQYDLKKLSDFAIGEAAFAASEPEQMNELSVLFQTGYLTLKGYSEPLYVLDFPNYEVKKSFFDSVVGHYSHIETGIGQSYIWQLTLQLKSGDVEGFFETLAEFFANIPYDITLSQEKYYQSLFYAIFTLIGFNIEAEVRTNKGRIDCVLHTDDVIYIIEFKLGGSKEDALQQILDKQYAQKYQSANKDIVLLGVAFDKDSRNIDDYVEHRLS